MICSDFSQHDFSQHDFCPRKVRLSKNQIPRACVRTRDQKWGDLHRPIFHPERWQSGRTRRSRKPLYRKVSRVRISPSPLETPTVNNRGRSRFHPLPHRSPTFRQKKARASTAYTEGECRPFKPAIEALQTLVSNSCWHFELASFRCISDSRIPTSTRSLTFRLSASFPWECLPSGHSLPLRFSTFGA